MPPATLHCLRRLARRFVWGVALALWSFSGSVLAQASAAALRLLEATPEVDRRVLQWPFSAEARGNWHYTPRSRDGLAWGAMSPAQVPRDIAGGPRKGFRLRADEEDGAFEWLASLNPAQRRIAVFDARPFGDIVSRNAARVNPLAAGGLPFADMNAAQQAGVLNLITTFTEHLRPEWAEARAARVRAGGLESIRIGWAGSGIRGEPYCVRIQGATFLIEFDNSGGNHIHSVWRDFQGDWGRDVLADHYRRAGAEGQPHRKP